MPWSQEPRNPWKRKIGSSKRPDQTIIHFWLDCSGRSRQRWVTSFLLLSLPSHEFHANSYTLHTCYICYRDFAKPVVKKLHHPVLKTLHHPVLKILHHSVWRCTIKCWTKCNSSVEVIAQSRPEHLTLSHAKHWV